MKYREHQIKGTQYQDIRFQRTFECEINYLTEFITKKNFNVLEIGTGNGRVLQGIADNLANRLKAREHPSNNDWNRKVSLIGIDLDENLLNMAREKEIGYTHQDSSRRAGILYFNMSVLNLKFQDKTFDLTFSTYNTIGGYDNEGEGIKPHQRKKFVDEMIRVTKDNGKIVNITWNNEDSTTKFLEKYYTDIGFVIESLTNEKSVVKSDDNLFVFERIVPEKLVKIYRKAGIREMEIKPIGDVWTAVTGYK